MSGTVISGTLKSYDLINAFRAELKRVGGIVSDTVPLVPPEAEGNPAHVWWDSEDADWLVLGLIESLNQEASDEVYFGAHMGDGADFGWWEVEDPCPNRCES